MFRDREQLTRHVDLGEREHSDADADGEPQIGRHDGKRRRLGGAADPLGESATRIGIPAGQDRELVPGVAGDQVFPHLALQPRPQVRQRLLAPELPVRIGHFVEPSIPTRATTSALRWR